MPACAGRELTDPFEELPEGPGRHAAVRRVLTDPAHHGLGEALEVHSRTTPAPPVLLRSRYKPGRTLRAYYRMRRSAGAREQHLAVTWSLQQEGGHSAAPDVLLSPSDPAMPQLERLADAGHVSALLEQLTGRAMPPAASARVTTVRYRPGQRHVLRVRLDSRGRSVYVKTDRDRSGARAVPVAELVRAVLARSCPEVDVVEAIGYSSASSSALWWASAGSPLARLLLTGAPGTSQAVNRLGEALRTLHEDPSLHRLATSGTTVRERDAAAEADALLGCGSHIAALLPDAARAFGDLASAALEDLEAMPEEEPGFTHGDFKAENVLVRRSRPRILDLDRWCRAEPALDLGKLLADLAWWSREPDEVRRLQRTLKAGYGPCDPVRWQRADRWAVLFMLKFAARRCLLHDPAWPSRVASQIDAAGEALLAARRSR
ncbi:MAG TPA: phosphotransferase [Marmoricola sp.]